MSVQSDSAISPLTRQLSDYIAGAADRDLPPAVAQKTKDHILDTLAPILSGSRLRAGKLATDYVGRFSGIQESTVIGTALMVPAEFAALANGMAGHADETDDSHLRGRFHPGCGIVPAALPAAEPAGLGRADLSQALGLGHDVGAPIAPARGVRGSDTASPRPPPPAPALARA